MVRPLRVHLPDAIYHVMSRGNARQQIFLYDADRRHFLRRLGAAMRRFSVRCHAYCLMPNHFHLIVRAADLPLGRMMQQLNGGYAGWVNSRYDRVGHLFQGRPKMLIVDDGEYFRRAIRYVVRNPVRANLAARVDDWSWSSYRATAGVAAGPPWLAVDDVWAAFHTDPEAGRVAFIAYCADTDFDRSSEEPLGPLIFGSSASAAGLSDMLAPHRTHREFVYAERYADRPALAELFSGTDVEDARQAATRCAFDDHGYTLREIAEFLGIAPATVWRHARGIAKRWKLRRSAEKIEI